METIIAAVISAVAAIIVCVINQNANQKKMLAELDKRDAIRSKEIEELNRNVARHNNLIERTYKLERDTAVIQNDIKVANHRIDDLERKDEKK